MASRMSEAIPDGGASTNPRSVDMAEIDRLPTSRQDGLTDCGQHLHDRLREHERHVVTYGDDLSEVSDWTYRR